MSDRKKDHLDLALESKVFESKNHGLFYEPMLAAHPQRPKKYRFLKYDFTSPLWISSMTGGTEEAKSINKHLALACEEFGLGMGLGSCRPLLESDQRLSDFSIKKYMPSRPLFSNFGIAQLEKCLVGNQVSRLAEVTKRLEADGIIIHVNPLQEWFQPEGDRYFTAPIETLKKFRDFYSGKLIVKEVGQGMGPKSIEALIAIGVDAIEFAAFGGTNFTKLEQRRSGSNDSEFCAIGHNAEEMVDFIRNIARKNEIDYIISGGINGPVHGHGLRLLLKENSLIGLASAVLPHARMGYGQLASFLEDYSKKLSLAEQFLKCGEV